MYDEYEYRVHETGYILLMLHGKVSQSYVGGVRFGSPCLLNAKSVNITSKRKLKTVVDLTLIGRAKQEEDDWKNTRG